jgi:hypothetical protein
LSQLPGGSLQLPSDGLQLPASDLQLAEGPVGLDSEPAEDEAALVNSLAELDTHLVQVNIRGFHIIYVWPETIPLS